MSVYKSTNRQLAAAEIHETFGITLKDARRENIKSEETKGFLGSRQRPRS